MMLLLGILIYAALFGLLWCLMRGSKDDAIRWPKSDFEDRTP
jgi:hypothetical protein